jgi:hypothetical protein
MKRGLLVLHCIVLATLVVASGRAQERPNGFYLTSPLSLGAGYDENFVINSTARNDTVSILTSPTFAWIANTHRTSFTGDYQPEFEIFARDQNLNAWNHSMTVRYSYRLTGRLSLDAGDSFLSTSDASRQLAESQFLLPRGRFQENSLFAGLKYRVDHRTILFFRFDHAITTMALSGPLGNSLDQMAYAGSMTLDHTVTSHHSFTGSYSYLHVRPLDGAGTKGYSYNAVNSLHGGYMYTVNSGLIFRVTGGVVHGRDFAYTAGGAVEKQLGGVLVIAGYQRYLSFFGGLAPNSGTAVETVPFANGLNPNSLFQAVSLRARGNLTKRVGLEFKGERGKSSLGDRNVRSLILQSRLDYKLNDSVILFVRAEYYGQNLSQFSSAPLSRRRYFGGLEIVLSRPPQAGDDARRHGKIPAESTEPQTEEPRAPEER